MEQQPLVSVIINCYNGEKYLREAIDSVIAQTYTNWEIIFWDNQSTDGTGGIVESYNSPKIHYIYAPQHTPLGEARNLAVEKANGEYINFLDADDIWSTNKLEEQIKLIEPGKCEVVYTHFKVKYEGGADSDSSMKRYYEELNKFRPNPKYTVFQNLLHRNWIIFSSVIFKKELFLSVGGINPAFKQNEDYEVLLKCALNTEIRFVDEDLVEYRIHDNNNSSKADDLYILETRKILRELPETKDVKKAYLENEARYAIYLWRKNKKKEAIKHLLRNSSTMCLINIICRKMFNK